MTHLFNNFQQNHRYFSLLFSAFFVFFSSVRFPKRARAIVCAFGRSLLSLLFILWIRLGLVAHTRLLHLLHATTVTLSLSLSLVRCCVCKTPNHFDVFAQCACTLFSVLSSLNSDFNALLQHSISNVSHPTNAPKSTARATKRDVCVCLAKVCVHFFSVGCRSYCVTTGGANVGCRHYAWWSNIIFAFCYSWTLYSRSQLGASTPYWTLGTCCCCRCCYFHYHRCHFGTCTRVRWHTTNILPLWECILFIPFYLWINFNILVRLLFYAILQRDYVQYCVFVVFIDRRTGQRRTNEIQNQTNLCDNVKAAFFLSTFHLARLLSLIWNWIRVKILMLLGLHEPENGNGTNFPNEKIKYFDFDWFNFLATSKVCVIECWMEQVLPWIGVVFFHTHESWHTTDLLPSTCQWQYFIRTHLVFRSIYLLP